MAKRRKRKRLKTRRAKSKLTLGRIAIALVLLGLIGYFVFTQVFFDPFEEAQARFDLLVPRDVDLYVSRVDLADDFDPFPVPRFVQRLLRTPEWGEVADSAWFEAQAWPDELAAGVAELRASLAQSPIDLVDDVLGQEVAFVGRNLGTGDFMAVVARLTPAGKVAVDSLAFEDVREQVFPGASYAELSDPDVPSVRYNHVGLPDGTNIYWARVTDALVLGNHEALVRDVLRSVMEGSENVVGLTRLWVEHMPPERPMRAGRMTLPFVADGAHFVETFELHPTREERSEDALVNILPNLFDVRSIEETVGRLDVDGGDVSLRLHADLNVQQVANRQQGGLVGRPPFRVHERLGDVLGLLPADVSTVVTMNVSLEPFFETVTRGFSSDLLTVINDALRDMSRFSPNFQGTNLSALIDEFAQAFDGELTIALRPIDHEVESAQQPLPAMAFILPVRNVAVWEEIENAFIAGYRDLGIDPDDMFRVDEGVGERKWLGLVAGPVEEIAFIVLDREQFVLTTDDDLLQEIVEVYTGRRNSIASRPDVRDLLQRFEQEPRPLQGNVAAWADSAGVARVLEPYAAWLAELETQLDFGVLRVQAERALLAAEYPQYADEPESMPEDVRDEVDAALDDQLLAQERERREVAVPAVAEEWWDGWSWLGLVRQVAAGLSLGDRTLDLQVELDSAASR